MIKFSKKILLIILSVFAGVVFLIINKLPLANQREKVVLNIDGRDYVLLTARTATERAKGLSGIYELKGADGMVFYFEPGSKPIFWNKNTYLDLEIIWMVGDEIVGRDFLPSEKKAGLVMKKPPQKIDKVIEIVRNN